MSFFAVDAICPVSVYQKPRFWKLQNELVECNWPVASTQYELSVCQLHSTNICFSWRSRVRKKESCPLLVGCRGAVAQPSATAVPKYVFHEVGLRVPM